MGNRTVKTRLGIIFADGNSKLGKVWNISKDHTSCDIKLSKYCKKYCYMNKLLYQSLPNITHAHALNTVLFKKYLSNRSILIKDIDQFLATRRISKLFRINVNGDLVNKSELLLWIEIARLNPDWQFCLFTKKYKYFTKSIVRDIPDNLNVLLSVFFNYSESIIRDVLNIGLPIAYTDTSNRYNYFECSKKCDLCLHCFGKHESVYLPLH